MSAASITQTDLEPIIQNHPGNHAFAEALERIKAPSDLVKVLTRYTYFNATFGAGVASLAAKIGTRPDLFRDLSEPVYVLSDRSMDIASDIFAAAVDEFDDRATNHKDTHRSLAQATLRATLDFFGLTSEQANQCATINEATRKAIVAVHQGYGVGRMLTDADIFQAIGFHIGSEVLADGEFHHMDDFFQNRYPELTTYLANSTVPINGERHAAYFWVRIHTSVEEDHFAFALTGANRALQYYVGALTSERAKEHLLAGVKEFAKLQQCFMAEIGN